MIACFYAKSRVPRGFQGDKSNKDMTISRNLVATIGAQASPKKSMMLARCRFMFCCKVPRDIQGESQEKAGQVRENWFQQGVRKR